MHEKRFPVKAVYSFHSKIGPGVCSPENALNSLITNLARVKGLDQNNKEIILQHTHVFTEEFLALDYNGKGRNLRTIEDKQAFTHDFTRALKHVQQGGMINKDAYDKDRKKSQKKDNQHCAIL